MKKILSSLMAVALLLSLCACGSSPAASSADASSAAVSASETAATQEFTDSLGRTVTLPADIQKVAISGPLAQIYLFALCPDKLVGVSNAWDETAKAYLDEKYASLPELGQLYGGKGELNPESLLSSGAEVVIDVGEPKKSAAEDLDALQQQTGIPFIHVTATLAASGDAYRMLGSVLGMPEQAEELAEYCDTVYANTVNLTDSVEKTSLLYCLGDHGQNVIARGSFQAELIDMMSSNAAVVDEPSSKGTGNEVDMEQILLWNPDVILFAPNSIYDTAADDAAWQQLTAIQTGHYYEVPFGPYNWLGFPPSVQRYLGMLWLSDLLYPEQANYDLFSEVSRYYELFYHCSLSREQFDALTCHSLPQ